MKKLQTILITGSLPYKLEIVKLDTIIASLSEVISSRNLKLLDINKKALKSGFDSVS